MNTQAKNDILLAIIERDNLTSRLREYQAKFREEYKAAMRLWDELHREELAANVRRARGG